MPNRFTRAIEIVESHWSLVQLVGSTLTGASMTLLTALTNTLETYEPVSWGIAFFLGVILFISTIWLFAGARHQLLKWRVRAAIYRETSHYINPLDSVFEGKRIYVASFFDPFVPLMEQKTFVDCDIVGPATVYIKESQNVELTNAIDCDWVIARTGAQLLNAFVFKNCTFKRCRFIKCTLIATKAEAQQAALKNVNWITNLPSAPTDTPQQQEPE